ncbi:hypothetical protein AWY79_15265 [Pseudodesulfovibrio indicus]|uniref:Uncharacterized protein n=1 Tax=Pseudodesulfovibrio indicus TaxID=1716143 RepID=A0ABM5YYX4_9BACT|nr:hypothetical protein AWY79_15265 [Pseudodesulfovibrio indicus]
MERVAGGPADVGRHLVGLEVVAEEGPDSAQAHLDAQEPGQEGVRQGRAEEQDVDHGPDQGRCGQIDDVHGAPCG